MLAYDAKGQVIHVEDAKGQAFTLNWSEDGTLASVEDGEETWTYVYGAGKEVVSVARVGKER
jgi:YD repeat-containing protein